MARERKVWLYNRNRGKRGKPARWALKWRDEAGNIRSETVGSDKKLAEDTRARRQIELNEGRYVRLRDATLVEFAKEHLALVRPTLSKASIKEHERALRNLIQFCGNVQLRAITPRKIEAFKATRLAFDRPATVNKYLRTLHSIFNYAMRREYLKHNPLDGIPRVREPEKEIRALSREELRKLVGACPDVRWQAFVLIAGTMGLRRGEMVNLRWQDVDFLKLVVRIVNHDGWTTKSKHNRIVPLAPAARDALMEIDRLYHTKGVELVFITANGTPWVHNLNRKFRQIVKAAGIAYCTMHDLRRTFCSQMAAAGVNEAVIQEAAGHASMETTRKYYQHIPLNVVREAQVKFTF